MYKSKYIHEYVGNSKKILVNTLLFNYSILKDDDIHSWDSNHFELLNSSKLQELTEKKFLFANVSDEDVILKRAMTVFGGKHGKTPSIYIYVTNECNLKCPYCFEDESRLSNIFTLSKDHIKNIIKAFNNINSESRINSVVIFGGEPLLPKNKEILDYLFEQLRKAGINSIEIVTNGVFLQEFEELLKRNEDIISNIRVTLNGPSYLHDKIRATENCKTFNTILNSIKFAIKKLDGVNIIVNVLMEERNIESISDLLDELYNNDILPHDKVILNFGRIQFRSNPENNFYIHELSYTDYFPRLIKQMKSDKRITKEMLLGSEVNVLGKLFRMWHGKGIVAPHFANCNATYPGRYCFYPDGNVYPCTEIAGNKNFAIATYFPQFTVLENNSKWKDLTINDFPKCLECKYMGMCSGGCLVSNIFVNNKINDAYCINIKESLDKFLKELDSEGFWDERN